MLIAFMLLLGGNSLDKAPPGSITDFVKSHGGHTVITKVSMATLLESRVRLY